MSEFLKRLFVSVLFALTFSWSVYSRYDGDHGSEAGPGKQQRYQPPIPTFLLPMFFGVLWILGLVFLDFDWTVKQTLSLCFSIFPHICLYYLVLMPLLPLLRRHISARACAMLWLIPNYLYITCYTFMALPSPAFVVVAPGSLVRSLLAVWLAGFFGVLAWKLLDHFRFLKAILRDAEPHPDVNVRSLLSTILTEVRYSEPNVPLYVSPAISTPLTVGLFKHTTIVFLPRREYTRQELELILRHEAVHICRQDAWSKFFLVFCTAMCWFNPLMWQAMRKSAEDLELSCDETVLLDADRDTRSQYARLVLTTAGDSRGFTTCLSASAESLRYRLKRITSPAVTRSGASIVGLAFLLLSMTSGYVALAYNGKSGSQVIFQGEDPAGYTLTDFHPGPHDADIVYHMKDVDALYGYLSGLTLYELTGDYTFSDSGRFMSMYFDAPGGRIHLYLQESGIRILRYRDPGEYLYYHVPEGIDWDFLDSLVTEVPTLRVWLTRPDSPAGYMLEANMTGLWRVEEDGLHLLREAAPPEHGLRGYRGEEATLVFSQMPDGPCTVLIETGDSRPVQTLTLDPSEGTLRMELPEYAAQYTVTASFRDSGGTLYNAEYRFILEQ